MSAYDASCESTHPYCLTLRALLDGLIIAQASAMIIHELTAAECEEFLGRATVGRLGCAHHSQPYIVPVSLYFGREEKCLYGFSTVGKKIEWMRENPRVCVEVDAI